MDDELGGRDVGRQAVVLGHVADALADRGALGGDVEAEHARPCPTVAGEQPEQDLDQRRLAGAVGADQPDDAGRDVDGELGQGGHPPPYRLVSASVSIIGMAPTLRRVTAP